MRTRSLERLMVFNGKISVAGDETQGFEPRYEPRIFRYKSGLYETLDAQIQEHAPQDVDAYAVGDEYGYGLFAVQFYRTSIISPS